MVSPRAPIGKRNRPSGEGGVGEDYKDPFEKLNEREQANNEGWISWVGSGVKWGVVEGASGVKWGVVEGAGAVMKRAGYNSSRGAGEPAT